MREGGVVSDAAIAKMVDDVFAEARPRDWLDDVFDGSMLDPVNAVPSLAALWAAAVVAGSCFAALAGIVIWAVIR